jgi:multiple antibiotic resistance protein
MIALNGGAQKGDIAFVPLAMPLMCGPGAIATMLGMTSLVKHSEFEFVSFLAIAVAILGDHACYLSVLGLCPKCH